MIQPTLFVDDLTVEAVGPSKAIVGQLVAFVKHVAGKMAESGMELSDTMCACNASTDERGLDLQKRLEPLAAAYQRRVKLLGWSRQAADDATFSLEERCCAITKAGCGGVGN